MLFQATPNKFQLPKKLAPQVVFQPRVAARLESITPLTALVECETALDLQGNEIHIRDAASGAKGYYCSSCGAEMVAHRKRRRNEDHFQHRPRYAGEVFDCLWSNESYRHKIAKKLVRLLRQLKVPALYPSGPTITPARSPPF